MKNYFLLTFIALMIFTLGHSQRAMFEQVRYFDVKTPKNPLDASINAYKVVVETPYTLTEEDVKTQSLKDFEEEKSNYSNVLKESEAEYQEKLASYDDDVKKAEERYDKEMKDFKELSLIERLALTDQGKKPKLVVPAKPKYIEPREPVYRDPNLNDYLIFDNQVLADGITLSGYERGEGVLFAIDISKMEFQTNGGQTFYSQPSKLTVLNGATVIDEKTFDEEFKFLTSSSSNTINLDRYEKNNVNKIMEEINDYINSQFGFVPVAATIKIEYPKNKKRDYDILENAKIKAVSAYRKLKEDTSSELREKVRSDLNNVRDIWFSELNKIDYKDKKAVMNKDIAKIIFFNLMKVDISLKDKAKAEETLNLMQEKRIDLDLSYDEKGRFTRLEEQIYNL
ncbi:hypothetical protein [Winogradskyella endarachnes]|uniref:Uncharacterized protein n=1 Tax=Winogradskyella endarachnes TaxID=2681965 RepID=A0A6L6U9P3_9FLAO|nr:hypothetical protein [Winogradskyella endarachnes]MUU77544.1 hypothetical protein [Winogradskyella endarachnes]